MVQGRPLFAPVGESAREATIKAERGGTEGSSRLELWETKSEVGTQSSGQTAQPSDVRGDGCHAFELKDEFVFLANGLKLAFAMKTRKDPSHRRDEFL